MARDAMALIGAGIAAADPARCTLDAMEQVLADPPDPGGGWRIVALGKAARAMAGAALSVLPDAAPALVVTNAGNDAPLAGARLLTAGHPVPDRAGAEAARELEALLRDCRPGDRLLALISGGGSAMLPAPVEGVGLEEKQQVSRLLLESGADIGQVNLIRQALSRLKGGGWLRLCRAPVTALILSDVPGDDLRLVASGPTVAPAGSRADAARMARQLGIWPALPASVRLALQRDLPVQPPVGRAARNLLIGSNRHSLRAMEAAGAVAGGLPLQGDVETCAQLLAAALRRTPPDTAVGFGGETTVRLRGDGMGGRNQELALRFALAAQRAGLRGDWRFAAIGTDGRDGPGQAAGGLVGPQTLARIRAAGIDPVQALARNDSTPALRAGGALVTTGPTGTNVADLAVFVTAPVPVPTPAASQNGTRA